MKQNFKLLLFATLLILSNALGNLEKTLTQGATTHKHFHGKTGFLSSKQTAIPENPTQPPTPTEPTNPNPSQPNQPAEPTQPTQPTQPEAPKQPQPTANPQTPPASEEGGSGWGIFFAVVIVIFVIVGIVYVYNMYQEHIIKTEGTMKSELGIKKQELNSQQILLLNLLTFNSKGDELTSPFFTEDVEIKHKKEEANKVVLGEYLQAVFKQQGDERLIVCNYPCNPKQECSYFEVELEQINQTNCDTKISIGFIAKSQLEEFKKNPTIGVYENVFDGQNSVSYSSNGSVKIGLSKDVDLGIGQVSYGETMGIGYTQKDQRVWITLNGEFLNPPPQEEIKKALEGTKKATKNDEEELSSRQKEETREESN